MGLGAPAALKERGFSRAANGARMSVGSSPGGRSSLPERLDHSFPGDSPKPDRQIAQLKKEEGGPRPSCKGIGHMRTSARLERIAWDCSNGMVILTADAGSAVGGSVLAARALGNKGQ